MLRKCFDRVGRLRDKLPCSLIVWGAVALFPLFCWALMEFAHPRELWLTWLKYLFTRLRYFALAWVVFSLLMAMVTLLTRRVWIAALGVSVLFAAASYSNYYKLANWEMPVMPIDLKNIANGIGGAGLISASPTKRMLFAWMLMAAVVLVLMLFKLPKASKKWVRPVLAGVLAVVLAVYFSFAFGVKENRETLGIEYSEALNRSMHYYSVSFFPGFFSLLWDQLLFPPVPAGYTAENLVTLKEEMALYETQGATPDIIVVLLETYHDVSRFGVELSADITENYDRIAAEGYSGNIITSLYGGNTANAEFEVLSGLATGNEYIQCVAYDDYVYDGMPSVASFLSSQGYRTEAFHSYSTELFNRVEAYDFLGFDHSTFHEDYAVDVERVRGFYSDRMSMLEIERAHKDLTAASDAPVFINMVTMQNHGLYEGAAALLEEQGYTLVRPVNSGLSPQADDDLAAQATLHKLTDEAIGELVDHFRTVDRDVVIVFYGDHQTAFNAEVEALGDTGDVLLDEIASHTTPYLVWSNFAPVEGGGTFGDLSLNALLPHVFDAYGITAPKSFGWMLNESREGDVKCVSGDVVILNGGGYGWAKDYADELDDYYTVLYDIINDGDNFSE